jgi:hypothetical protein
MAEAAVQTTTSTASIWAIIIVATVALAFWLTAIMLADRSQVRASGAARASEGTWTSGSVPGERAREMPDTAASQPVGAPGRMARDESLPQGEIPTRADLPAQRTGDTDRPAHSYTVRGYGARSNTARGYTGPAAPDEEERGR